LAALQDGLGFQGREFSGINIRDSYSLRGIIGKQFSLNLTTSMQFTITLSKQA